MEIDKSFVNIRTVLLNLQISLSTELKDIDLRQQNNINSIIKEFRQHGFFEKKEDNYLRSIHLSLLINTDLKLRDVLSEDHNCGHIVDVFPMLSVSLYFVIIIEFKLVRYLEETIKYGPVALGIEVLDVIEDKRKYLSITDYPYFTCSILNSIYSRLCNVSNVNTKYVLPVCKKLVNIFKMYSLSLGEDKIPQHLTLSSTEDKCKFKGYKFYNLLRLLKECIAKNGEQSAQFYSDIYNIDIPVDYSSWSSLCNEPKDNFLTVCFELLVMKCKIYLYQLDVEEYVEWHEIEYYGCKTLQYVIRKEIRNLLFQIRNNIAPESFRALFTDDLISIFSSLSLPEDSVEESINSDDEDVKKEKWFLSTLSDDTFIKNNDTITLIKVRLDWLNDDQITSLLNKIFEIATKNNLEVENVLQELVFALFKKIEFNKFMKYFHTIVENFEITKLSGFILRDTLYISKNADLIFEDVYNNAAEISDDKKEIIRELILQAIACPDNTLLDIIGVGIEQGYELKNIIKLIQLLIPIYVPSYNNKRKNSSNCLHPILIQVCRCHFGDWLNIKKKQFSLLLHNLVEENLVTIDNIIADYILALQWGEEIIFFDLFTVLSTFFEDVKSFDASSHSIALLENLANTMEQFRTTTINNFSSSSANLLDGTVEIVRLIYQKVTLSSTDMIVMKENLKALSNLTKSYFLEMENTNEDLETKIICMIHHHNPAIDDYILRSKPELILIISKMFVKCSYKEISSFASSAVNGNRSRALLMLNIFRDVITLLSGFIRVELSSHESDTNTINEWFGYVIQCFLRVVQHVFMPLMTAEGDAALITACIIHIIVISRKTFTRSTPLILFNILKFVQESFPIIEAASSNIKSDIQKLAFSLLLISV